MRGQTLLNSPAGFPTFELAHRFEGGEHRFEVAYGSSFNELYYDFSTTEFFASADRPELTKQLKRAGAGWVLTILHKLRRGRILSAEQVRAWPERARKSRRLGIGLAVLALAAGLWIAATVAANVGIDLGFPSP